MHKKTIYVATNNQHKVDEMVTLMPASITLIRYQELGQSIEWVEDGATFAENSKIKCRAIAAKTSEMVLADDSGLCVESLNLQPGVHSARYAGEFSDDAANRALLLLNMKHLKKIEQRRGYFIAVLTLCDERKNEFTFEGRCEGAIAFKEQGENGFGYDAIFIPTGEKRTFAEMHANEKNRFSHRALAMHQVAQHLLRI